MSDAAELMRTELRIQVDARWAKLEAALWDFSALDLATLNALLEGRSTPLALAMCQWPELALRVQALAALALDELLARGMEASDTEASDGT